MLMLMVQMSMSVVAPRCRVIRQTQPASKLIRAYVRWALIGVCMDRTIALYTSHWKNRGGSARGLDSGFWILDSGRPGKGESCRVVLRE